MPQPPAYNRQYNFTDFSTSFPSDQQPGIQMDAEWNAVKATLDAILANLLLIQRDDGAPKNSVVTLDTLAADVLSTLGSGNGWVPRGAWATATVYAVGDVVSQSGTTYVCNTAHTAAASFATDTAKWTAIFGTVTATVPDGSVTTPKIVDGAVTTAKLGFTALALTGNLSGATLSAGTLVAGTYTFGGKTASGAAIGYIGRTTRAQGATGIYIDGGTSGSVWQITQASGGDDLSAYNTLGAKTSFTWYTGGNTDWNFTHRVTGQNNPASGSGVETYFASNVGYILSYDRGSSAYRDMKIQGLTVALSPGGTDVLTASASGVAMTEGTVNNEAIGYRNIPQNSKTSSYTLDLPDAGKHIMITTGGVVIPANASVAFPIGTAISIYNDSNATQTISITTDTLRLAGTASTGSRTLAVYGVATILKVKSNAWVISGTVT